MINPNISQGMEVLSEDNGYNEDGSVTESVISSGTIKESEKNEYDILGRLIETEDEKGIITQYVYDGFGRVISITQNIDGKVETTTAEYNLNGFVTKETDKRERVIIHEYDNMGREIKQSLTYGDESRKRSISYGHEFIMVAIGPVTNNYTSWVDVTTVKNTTDEVISQTYTNGLGQIVKETSNGISTYYSYDKQGNIFTTFSIGVDETDGSKGKLSLSIYDVNGRLTDTIINPKYEYETGSYTVDAQQSIVTSNVYDDSGNLVQTVDGEGNKTLYAYDESGNKSREILSNGCSITYEYDIKNRLIASKEYSKSGTYVKKTEYQYNIEDMLTESIDSNVSEGTETPYRYTIYEYDGLNRMVGYAEIDANSEPSDETISNYKIVYKYDIDDKLIETHYPDSAEDELKGLTFEYNSYKWLTGINGIVKQSDTESVRKIREYEYYSDNKLKAIKDYRGFLKGTYEYIQKTYEYDVFDRVTKMSYADSSNINAVLEQYEYSYDKNNNILSERIISDYESNSEYGVKILSVE